MQKRDINTSIRELVGLLPPRLGLIVETACRQNLRRYPLPDRSKFELNAFAHSYGPNRTKICDGKFVKLVFDEMLNDGRCSAPTHSNAPIYTGKVEILYPFRDMVLKIVDGQEYTVYNVTLPKHVLFPGYVKLVVQEGTIDTEVAVSGKGIGNWKWANTKLGPVIFGSILEEFLVPKVKQRLQRLKNFKGSRGSFGGAGASGRF